MTKAGFAVLIGILTLALTQPQAFAASGTKAGVFQGIDGRREANAQIALKIWNFAELGYQEQRSSALLQETLASAGFRIEAGVADIPTAFVASWGTEGPVIGILAEFDALPGISQTADPVRQSRPGTTSAHACGHHLFGTGSAAAAIAIKQWLEESGTRGTIRLYGTPAEEGGAGKVYMVRAGLFDDVDAVLSWHPDDENAVSASSNLAVISAKFRFHGVSAHAAAAPEKARSALDGVEGMTHMVNMLREHMDQEARIHYVITAGGFAPNVVPNFAEVYFYVRHPDVGPLKELWNRVVKTAEGAAQGTGTRMDYEIIHGEYNMLPNEVLAKLAYENMSEIGGFVYSDEERAFATVLRQSLATPRLDLGSEETVQPFKTERQMGSSDLGDISWLVPLVSIRTATWVPGTSAHSWQAVAAGGMSIGIKGMQLAAKILAATAIDLYGNPQLLASARTELMKRRGTDFQYSAVLGDRAPALDYRSYLAR